MIHWRLARHRQLKNHLRNLEELWRSSTPTLKPNQKKTWLRKKFGSCPSYLNQVLRDLATESLNGDTTLKWAKDDADDKVLRNDEQRRCGQLVGRLMWVERIGCCIGRVTKRFCKISLESCRQAPGSAQSSQQQPKSDRMEFGFASRSQNGFDTAAEHGAAVG